MKRNGIKYKTIKEAHDAACEEEFQLPPECKQQDLVENLSDMEREHRRMKYALENIEEYVKPGPDGYPTINSGDAQLMHLICCIARGGTIANGAIQPPEAKDV